MIPKPAKTLSDLAMRIVGHIAPQTTSKYAQTDSALISGLLLTMAQDYERGIYNCMTDVDEMKSIFKQALEGHNREAIPNRDSLQAFTTSAPDSLMLSDVTALHAQGFELLIPVHAWAEVHDEDLNLEIWRLLRRHSERNKFDTMGP